MAYLVHLSIINHILFELGLGTDCIQGHKLYIVSYHLSSLREHLGTVEANAEKTRCSHRLILSVVPLFVR